MCIFEGLYHYWDAKPIFGFRLSTASPAASFRRFAPTDLAAWYLAYLPDFVPNFYAFSRVSIFCPQIRWFYLRSFKKCPKFPYFSGRELRNVPNFHDFLPSCKYFVPKFLGFKEMSPNSVIFIFAFVLLYFCFCFYPCFPLPFSPLFFFKKE